MKNEAPDETKIIFLS
jgi:hypothetical protein